LLKILIFHYKKQTQKEWQVVFIICAVIYVVGGIIDMLCLTAELQPWAKLKPEEAVKEQCELKAAEANKDEFDQDDYYKTSF
jgi:hypothetical protein